MPDSAELLRLYGVPFSQPVRAVMWLLLFKRQPFELILTNPGSKGDNGSRHPDFLKKNPAGTIPCIEEADGFTLAEGHAILCYLCNRHGWTDVYPDAPRDRARVDWYLHYHHRNLRDASIGLVAPSIRKDLDIPELIRNNARATLGSALRTLDEGWLKDSRFLAGDAVSIADMAAYVEIGQLKPGFTNVWDFSDTPNVQRWLEDMTTVDSHDDVHVVLSALGDISQEAPAMDAIRDANKQALSVLKSRLSAL